VSDAVPDLTRRPARASSAIAAAALLGAALASAPYSRYVIWCGGPAVALLAVGLTVGSRRAVTFGCATLLVGVLAAGVEGLPAVPTLASVTATVVAWDAGHQAVGVGEQLGRESRTVRAELPHVGATAAVGAAIALGSYAAFLAAPGGLPVSAVALALLGAVSLLAALRVRGE